MHGDDPQARSDSGRHTSRLPRLSLYVLVAVLAIGGALLGGLRFLLPEIRHLRPEIEGWVSGVFEREVRLGAIDAYWRGWTPVLRVEDVRLVNGESADGEDGESPLRLSEVSFSIDPLKSLRLFSVQPFDIAAHGASIEVVRNDDGTFSLHGLGKPSDAESHGASRFVLWALAQSRLSLFDSQAVWIDRQNDSHEATLDGLTLHMLRSDDGYRFAGSFRMPEDGRVEFIVDLNGEPLSPSWTGSVYALIQDVELGHTGLDARRLGGQRLAGRVSGEVWSTLTPGGFIEAEGTIRAEAPGVVLGEIRRGVDEISTAFRIGHTPEGWELAMNDLVVVTPRGEWPRTRASIRWTPPRLSGDGIVVLNAGHVRIDDLVAIFASDDGASAGSDLGALIASAPRGVLEELHVSAPVTDRIELNRARARGRFVDLGLGTEANAVSVGAARGSFEAGEAGLVADVENGAIAVNLPRWFAYPLRGVDVAGSLAALPSPEGLRFRLEGVSMTTPTGTIAAHGWVLAPRDRDGLQLDITVDVGPARFAPARELLAGGVLPEPVSRWLESAAPDGDVRAAQLHIRKVPSRASANQGGPNVSASVELAFPSFRYARGWPEIVDATGRLRWHDGGQLEVQVEAGRILDSNVRTGSIVVSDLRAEAPGAEIRGSVDGSSRDVIRFLAESPLRHRFSSAFDGWTVRGDSTVDFGLNLRFEPDGIRASVAGGVTIAGNRVRIPALRNDFAEVSGEIRFGSAGVKSDGLTATWHGEPLRATIGPSPESNSAARISIEGRMTPLLLAELLHENGLADSPQPEDSPLFDRVDGDAALNVTVDVPSAGHAERGWQLNAVTDLAGVTVDLPPPFGKPPGPARELAVGSTVASGSKSVVRMRYGQETTAMFELLREDGGLRLERGMVRFDAQPATLPDTTGITVHGAVSTLDTRAWLNLLDGLPASSAPDSDATPTGFVREWSISAGTMIAAGARFPETGLRAMRDAAGGWEIRVSGSNAEGLVRIPPDPRVESISADFVRFVFEPQADGARPESASHDPRTLPGLSLSAKQVVLEEYDLGAVSLTTTPSEDGMVVERIEVQTDGYRGSGTGRWSLGEAGHRTDFDVQIHGDDLGRMLDALGYDGSAVKGGVTSVAMDGSWPGTPGDFAPEKLRGVIHLSSTDGNLTQIERGVPGRVFGLITFTSLPRRLLLDFGDLFSRGIEFDLIKGSFALENGNAYTEDLFMESDTARIEVVGRTGLLSRDYDKLVTVTPKISSSLPLVPIWVLQKLLDRNLFDKAFAYQYTISGPWDDPIIDLVGTERLPDDSAE